MNQDHDSGYRRLFSHPEMVRDLLLGYAPGNCWAEVDFSTLEPVSGSFVSESLRQRHSDAVWRLRYQEGWLWIYLLLEFQSEPDPWMALRMLVYVGLLMQELVKRGELLSGKLPPVLPLVLYNGLPEWKPVVEVSALFIPPPAGLEPFQPRLAYHLVDEIRLQLHPAEAVRTAVEALFSLEQGGSPQEIQAVLCALVAMLDDPALSELRHSFTAWVKRFLERRVPPEYAGAIADMTDLRETQIMVKQSISDWFEEKWQQGLEQGVQQGLQQGRHEGMEQGMQRGIQRGIQQGVQQGVQQGEWALLSRQLTRRFGPLPESIALRLADASVAQLEHWGDRVLEATSLEDVFQAH